MSATIGIEVTANTSAAVRALRDLEDATTAATDAADAAGEGQKTLAQQTARAKEMQLAANEAVKRAQQALAEHNDTVRTHGRDSKEAAASLARLKAAQEAAAAASAKSEKALAAVAEQTAKAVRESDKLTPALARVSKEVKATGAQAEKAASDLRRLDMAITSASASAGDGGERVGMLGQLAGRAAGMLGPAMLAGAATAAARALGEAAGEMLSFQTAIKNIPFGLDRARAATGGLVDDMQLAASAAQGTALGVVRSEEEFASLAEAATKLGIKLRIGPAQALDNMMTALGRGSSEILDNLGVAMKASEAYDRYAASIGKSASELTEAEKKVAFKVEAIKALQKAASETTVELDSGAAAIVRFGVRIDNVATSVKRFAVDSVGELLLGVETTTNAVTAEIERLAAAQAENADGSASLARHLQDGISLGGSYITSLVEQARAHLEVADAVAQRTSTEDDLWKKLEQRNAAAEQRAIEEAFFAANAMGPALPPGFVKAEDRPRGRRREEKVTRLDNAELRDITRQGMVDPMQEAERARAALEAEEALREKRLVGLDREIAALETRGIAEAERIDMIFTVVEVESEAARQREALIDQRLASEARLARWQASTAKTTEDREKALTRMERVEHERRLVTLRRAADEEAATHRKREKVVSAVTGAVTQLSETMVEGIERAAKGERGAVAEMIGELLKGVAKKHAIFALSETALGVGAAASYRYAAAAQHFAAAGLHTGVAVAAGAGAYAAGQVAASRSGGSETMGASGGGGGGGSVSSPRRREDGDLEAQQTPISHEQLRRGDASASTARSEGGVQIHINSPTINGAGGLKEFAHLIRREFERQDRGGYRPRL